ncbi:MAG TPA: class I SAM-dependent methyltransferase [Planctomycetota bacterium]|nr:class I SAM-dependent methyltransferase [Planctomycetota bacterium]
MYPPSRAAQIEAGLKSFQSAHASVRQSRFFRALIPPNSVYDRGRSAREARVREKMSSGFVLNLGSKSADWGTHVLNVDLAMPAAGGVDLLADIARLPFADASVDAVICTYVLEHVADARACIDGIARVVKPGGYVYVAVPFLFPTHPDPLDRWRWTLDGLRHSMSAFEEIEAGNSGGPFSAYVSIVPTLTASIFSNFYLFNAVRFALGWLLWPLKFLDCIASRSDKAYMASANFYFFGRRR